MMKVDMSAEAITNRLNLANELWELGVTLARSQEISDSEVLHDGIRGKDWNENVEGLNISKTLETV
jgi:hypothetical protein